MRLTRRSTQNASGLPRHIDAEKHLWRVNWRQHGYSYCGIYAVSPDNRWPTKIGISQNPVKRLITLQNACWKRLDIVEYRYCENFNAARAVEKKAHEILTEDNRLMLGEWFDIRPDKALETIEFAAQVLGVELYDRIPDGKVSEAIFTMITNENVKGRVAMYEEFDERLQVGYPQGWKD